MSALQQPEPMHMTVEEYFALEAANPEGRYEYIDGYVRDLRILNDVGGSNKHAVIAADLIIAFGNALGDNPCRVYSADVKLKLNAARYLHPDVSVSCDEGDAQRDDGIERPIVVCEILSPSTESFDRGRKLKLYQTCSSIQEILLIDQHRQSVDVYQRQSATMMLYRAYGPGESITLASIGITIPIATLYRHILLPPDGEDAL